MGQSQGMGEVLVEFKDEHLLDRKEVNKFRKLRKYSKFGVYVTGFLIYAVMALYFSANISITDGTFIGTVLITLLSFILTILFWLNRRSYDFSDRDLVYHEVAVLIDEVEKVSKNGDLSAELSRFHDRVLDGNSGVVPQVWREELETYCEYIENRDGKELNDDFTEIFTPFVDTLNNLSSIDLESIYIDEDDESEQTEIEPGFFSIVIDSVTSDVVTKEMLIWGIFLIAVSGALLLALIRGQGWGVLLVTIVFGGIRLYDQQRE